MTLVNFLKKIFLVYIYLKKFVLHIWKNSFLKFYLLICFSIIINLFHVSTENLLEIKISSSLLVAKNAIQSSVDFRIKATKNKQRWKTFCKLKRFMSFFTILTQPHYNNCLARSLVFWIDVFSFLVLILGDILDCKSCNKVK